MEETNERVVKGIVIGAIFVVFHLIDKKVLTKWCTSPKGRKLFHADTSMGKQAIFHRHMRSYQTFVRGKKDAEAPPKSPYAFQTHMERGMYTIWRGSVLAGTWRYIVSMLIYATFIREVFLDDEISDDDLEHIEALVSLQEIFSYILAFLLGIHVYERINKMFNIQDCCWGIQGRLHSLGLLIGGALGNTKKGLRYRLYRYLNLAHFFEMQARSDKLKKISIQELVDCGLMTEKERVIIENSDNFSKEPLIWSARLIEVNDFGKLENHKECLVEELCKLRGLIAGLGDHMEQGVPFSFNKYFQLIVDTFLSIAPFAVYAVKQERVWVYVGTFFITFFYKGLFQITKFLRNPFQDSLDGLDAEALLLSTENRLFQYMSDCTIQDTKAIMDHEDEALVSGVKMLSAENEVPKTAITDKHEIQEDSEAQELLGVQLDGLNEE